MLFFGLLNLVENMEQTTPARAVIQSLGATAGILLSALCIIYLYNGKRSEKHRTFSKWFFYYFLSGTFANIRYIENCYLVC